jgi:predicted GH43/DUF377 family glycosyl hydrolase
MIRMMSLGHVGACERLGYVFSAAGTDSEYRVANPSIIRRPGRPAWMIYRSVNSPEHPDENLRASSHCDRAVLGPDGTWVKQGAVLSAVEQWETGRSWNCFGVEDPRVEYLPELGVCLLAYCAGTSVGPRVAIAVSSDEGVTWRKLGLLRFPNHSHLEAWDNKNATWFPRSVLSPTGVRSFAMVHRAKPSTGVRIPGFKHGVEDVVDAMRTDPKDRPSMHIGYVPVEAVLADIAALTRMEETITFFTPADVPWEPGNQVGIGAGSQWLDIPGRGFLSMYHGVHVRDYVEGRVDATTGRYDLSHWGGLMLLDPEQPHKVLAVAGPALYPQTPEELGDPAAADLKYLSTKVTFATHIEFADPSRLVIWYGAGDRHVARARLTLAEPVEGVEYVGVAS